MGGEVGRPVSRCVDAIFSLRWRRPPRSASSLGSLHGPVSSGALGAPCFVLVLVACAACGSSVSGGSSTADAGAAGASDTCPSRFATSVVSFTPGPGPTTGQAEMPEIVLGPPKGGGASEGSLDDATLGNGGSITLGFAPSVIVDGEGPDFIVFENPFDVDGDPKKPFAELATVAVSDDGQNFQSFPCTATAYPYGSCAGWHPVFANPDENTIDPTDPAVAGGDAFDLADLGISQARYVRITDRVDLTGPNGTFDLDAVSIVHAACP